MSEHVPEHPTTGQWWSLSGDELLAGLRAVAAGGDPDTVYLEMLANSDVTPPDQLGDPD